MVVELHPSIEATLQDFVRGNHEVMQEDATDCDKLWRMFNAQYHVEDWGITRSVFGDFMVAVFMHERCEQCGCKGFPYFMSGDKLCVRCEV